MRETWLSYVKTLKEFNFGISFSFFVVKIREKFNFPENLPLNYATFKALKSLLNLSRKNLFFT
jgi:hypothetical protein